MAIWHRKHTHKHPTPPPPQHTHKHPTPPPPVNTKHLYNICTTLVQRLRRCSNIVQMLYKCFVFTGTDMDNWLISKGAFCDRIDCGWRTCNDLSKMKIQLSAKTRRSPNDGSPFLTLGRYRVNVSCLLGCLRSHCLFMRYDLLFHADRDLDINAYPVNTKHMYSICTMLDQRRRRWADVVQNVIHMFCVCWDIDYYLEIKMGLTHSHKCRQPTFTKGA